MARPRRGLADGTAIILAKPPSSSSVRQSAVAVHELLLGSIRRLVELREARELPEHAPDLTVQLIGAVSHHVETAAALGPRRTKGRRHDVPAGLERALHGRHVTRSRVILAQEVEHGAIVPELEFVARKLDARDVAGEPAYGSRPRPQSLPRGLDRPCGNVQDADTRVATVEQVVYERRGPAADVDDGGIGGKLRPLDEPQRAFEMRPGPTHPIPRPAAPGPIPLASVVPSRGVRHTPPVCG